MGRMLVIPSRAESLPYVVLEAAAAGVPIIATDVGGIAGDIRAAERTHLIPPGDVGALAGAIAAALDDPARTAARRRDCAGAGAGRVLARRMVDAGLAAYREALALRKLAQFA